MIENSNKDINLFEVDKDFNLIIDRKGLKAIKCFRELIESDKGSKGDHDGRDKLWTIKVLMYIWLMYDFLSPFINYDDEERRIESLKSSELEEHDLDRPVVTECILFYQAHVVKSNPKIAMLYEAKTALDKIKIFLKTTHVTEDNIKIYRETAITIDSDIEKLQELEGKIKLNKEGLLKAAGGAPVNEREI